MEKNPCTCGGENPNCYRCYGTGMVSSRVLPIRSDGRVRPQINSQNPTPITLPTIAPIKPAGPIGPIVIKKYACQKCGEIYTDPTQFIHHVRTFHPNLKTSKSKNHKKQKITQPASIQRTIKQDDAVNEITLETLGKNQLLIDQGRDLLKKLRRSYPQAQMCNTCFQLFKTKLELVKHTREIHTASLDAYFPPNIKKKTNNKNKEKIVEINKSKISFGNFGFIDDNNEKTGSLDHSQSNLSEKRMDATYGLGGFARDNGQFGSSSAYDSMDDESSP